MRYDDAIVGAGIVGLAHAYHLSARGRRVIVFERSSRAAGASIRNFGMLWPIGQPAGEMHDLALRSRDIWLQALAESGIWHDRCGSLHLAYRDDEAAVLREFTDAAPAAGYEAEILAPAEVWQRAPFVREAGLQFGMWSATETCVDPREAVAGLAAWLARERGVEFVFDSAVTGVYQARVVGGGRDWTAGRVWICCGDDLQTLYPQLLTSQDLTRCKLQMMRSAPYAGGRLGPMLAAGLTLRHYKAFQDCPTLPALRERVARETPEIERCGIHVMTSQNGRDEVVIGDSHEYGDAIEPFDKMAIDELVLGYLATFLDAPGLEIASRWHGVYTKHPTRPYVALDPEPGVTVVTGLGGAGMTLSFGVAERTVAERIDPA